MHPLRVGAFFCPSAAAQGSSDPFRTAFAETVPLRSFRAEVSEQDAAYIQSLLPGNTNLSEAIEVIAYYNIKPNGWHRLGAVSEHRF